MASKITTIESKKNWLKIDWREIWSYRELLLLLAKRDVSVIYKQTILGPAWFLIQPILTSLVFAVVFGRIAKIPTQGLPRFIFYMSGLLMWNYFRGVLEGSGQVFNHYKQLYSKVYFPRLVAPLSLILSNLVYLGLNTIVFILFYLYYCFVKDVALHPSWTLVFFPLVVLYVAATALGFGLWIAALTAKYRDLRFALPFITQVWLYSTPIIYPLKGVVDPFFRTILLLNPMTVAVEACRFMFTSTGAISLPAIGMGAIIILVVLTSGLAVFNRVQQTFVDVI